MYSTTNIIRSFAGETKGFLSRNAIELAVLIVTGSFIYGVAGGGINVDSTKDQYHIISNSVLYAAVASLFICSGSLGHIIFKETGCEYEQKYQWRYYNTAKLFRVLKKQYPKYNWAQIFADMEEGLRNLDMPNESRVIKSMVANTLLYTDDDADMFVQKFRFASLTPHRLFN
jgi:hypothetical protein